MFIIVERDSWLRWSGLLIIMVSHGMRMIGNKYDPSGDKDGVGMSYTPSQGSGLTISASLRDATPISYDVESAENSPEG